MVEYYTHLAEIEGSYLATGTGVMGEKRFFKSPSSLGCSPFLEREGHPDPLAISPGPIIIPLFTSVITNFRNKLECLSLAGLSNLVKYLRLMLIAYPIMEHLEDALLRQAPCLTCKH
jgi:hypothetical protein